MRERVESNLEDTIGSDMNLTLTIHQYCVSCRFVKCFLIV